MSLLKIYLTAIVLFMFSITAHSQDDVEEMEEKLKDTSLSKEEQLRLYDYLSWSYHNLDIRTSLTYAKKGLILAEQLKADTTKAYLFLGMGTAYHLGSSIDSAAFYYNKAKSLGDELNDTKLIFMINNSLGNLHSELKQFDKALYYYQANLRLAQSINEETSICYSLGNIGVIYQHMGNFEKAEEYMIQSKEMAERLSYKTGLAATLLNLSELYILQKNPAKGEGYAERAAELFHEIDYFPEEVRALLTVSRYYLYSKDYLNALAYVNKAYELAKDIDLPTEIGLCYRAFCFIFYEKNNLALAEEYAMKALQLIDSTDYNTIELHEYLVKIHIDMGDAVNAKKSLDTYSTLMRTFNNREMQNVLSEMEVEYEIEKKDTQISMLTRGKRLYSIFTFLGLFTVLLLLTLLALLNRYQLQKRLHMKEKMRQLEQEKELIAARSLLEGENMERSRLSRELHDSLGGLLTMIKLDLEQLKRSASPQPSLKEKERPSQDNDRMNTALKLTNKSIEELHQLAHSLMPESLVRFGLRPVLEEFCEGNPQINFCFYGENRRFDNEIETNFYRIACELINNALKHASASVINVQLINRNDTLSLTVQDDGCGFDKSVAKQGLITVRSRAGLLGAELIIYTEEGKGTEITVELHF